MIAPRKEPGSSERTLTFKQLRRTKWRLRRTNRYSAWTCNGVSVRGMTLSVTSWRCKCGVRVKAVAELDGNDATTAVMVNCPQCGDEQTIPAERLVAVVTDSDNFSL